MKFIHRQKFFLTIAVATAGMGFFGWMMGWLLIQINEVGVTLRGVAEKMAKLEVERKTARGAHVFLKERAEDLAKINNFFVDRERPVEFIENLEEIAKKTKNQIVIDFDEGRSKERNLFFRLVVDGSEASIRKYLKLLELMPYKIKVGDLTFQKISVLEQPAFLSRSKTLENPMSHRLVVLIQVETL